MDNPTGEPKSVFVRAKKYQDEAPITLVFEYWELKAGTQSGYKPEGHTVDGYPFVNRLMFCTPHVKWGVKMSALGRSVNRMLVGKDYLIGNVHTGKGGLITQAANYYWVIHKKEFEKELGSHHGFFDYMAIPPWCPWPREKLPPWWPKYSNREVTE